MSKKQSGTALRILFACVLLLLFCAGGAYAEGPDAPQNLIIEPCDLEDWQAYYQRHQNVYFDEDEYDYGFFKITWDPVPGAKEYYLSFFRDAGNGAYAYGYVTTPWNEYYCVLFQDEGNPPIEVCVNTIGQDGNVSVDCAYGICIPVMPNIQLKCTGTDDGAVLFTWDTVSRLPEDQRSFAIYRQEEGSGGFVRIGESKTCSYLDTNVSEGKTYSYKVLTETVVDGLPGVWKSASFTEPAVITVTGGKTNSAFTGLRKDDDGVWRYYENGVFAPKMCLVEYGEDLVYVADGLWASRLNGLWDDSGHWYLFAGGVVQKDYTGLYQDTDGTWWLIRSGMADFSYDGLYYDQNIGWTLLYNGRSAADYNGLYCDREFGWWLVRNGQIAFDYTGLWYDPNYGWWLIGDGRLCNEYNGLWCDPDCGWWLIKDGTIDFGYTGLYCDANAGWWLIGGGTICWDYTGLWNDPNYGWWLISNGTICWDYTGLWNDPNYGWWLIGGGTICWDYTGLWCDPNCGWWLIGGGTIAWDYNGLWNDPNCGWWLINGGTINWGYTGGYDEFGATWNIVNGQLIF